MKIGLLSDTHGRLAITRRALRLLGAQGVQHYVHCGDLGDGVLDLLAGLPASFVFGNNDYDRESIERDARRAGVECLGTYGTIELAGKVLAVTHGDEPRLIRKALADPAADYLLTGHTHAWRDERLDGVRWINPGALHRAATKTVATLDLATDVLRRFVVDEEAH